MSAFNCNAESVAAECKNAVAGAKFSESHCVPSVCRPSGLSRLRADFHGGFELLKCSEHGLGHLLSPLPEGSTDKWPDVLWAHILMEELEIPHETPEWFRLPAISRMPISSPAYFREFRKRYAELPYAERIKPFGFLTSVQVARFGHPAGADPTAFHLLAPLTRNPNQAASQLWTNTYSFHDYRITTSLSYCPEIVRVRSIADIAAEFVAHGEVKSATASGEPAGAGSRGLLQRRHVTPAPIRLIGKEPNNLDQVAAGMHGDWDEILNEYQSRYSRPSRELLMAVPASAIARAWGVSVRTVRMWRKRAANAPRDD